jgi:hypothetical protein
MIVAKPFDILFAETDSEGGALDWEWNAEDLVFEATDTFGNSYTLKPLIGEFTAHHDGEDPAEEADEA